MKQHEACNLQRGDVIATSAGTVAVVVHDWTGCGNVMLLHESGEVQPNRFLTVRTSWQMITKQDPDALERLRELKIL